MNSSGYVFLRGIHWNTSGLRGIYSTTFQKFDPKWDNICQIDRHFWNFEEYGIPGGIWRTWNTVTGPPLGYSVRLFLSPEVFLR